jgi:hypothetical protein
VLCLPHQVDLCPQSSCPALLTGTPDTVDPFGFIDKSLSLLGDLQRTQDSHIWEQFEQQRAFIAGKFEQAQYECGQRDCIVGQRFTKTEEEIERLKEDVGERFGLVEIGL